MPIRYTVVSTKRADDELLRIWLDAPGERAAITRASHELEQDLRTDADQKGIPLPVTGGLERRAWERYPLRVYFEVSEPDRLVRIIGFDKLPPSP